MKRLLQILVLSVTLLLPLAAKAQSTDLSSLLPKAKEYAAQLDGNKATTGVQHEAILSFLSSSINQLAMSIVHGGPDRLPADKKAQFDQLYKLCNGMMTNLGKLDKAKKLNNQNRGLFRTVGTSWNDLNNQIKIHKDSPSAATPAAPSPQASTQPAQPSAPQAQPSPSTSPESPQAQPQQAAQKNVFRDIQGTTFLSSQVENQPFFPGGENALNGYIKSKMLQYPEDARVQNIEGRVIVGFIIAADGQACNPIVLKGVYPALDRRAVEIIGEMPAWSPARNEGAAVNCIYVLPINFELPK